MWGHYALLHLVVGLVGVAAAVTTQWWLWCAAVVWHGQHSHQLGKREMGWAYLVSVLKPSHPDLTGRRGCQAMPASDYAKRAENEGQVKNKKVEH
jgi:hypothetical protein